MGGEQAASVLATVKRDAIEAAIRMAIRQGVRPIDGRQPIRGVQIFQDVKAVIR